MTRQTLLRPVRACLGILALLIVSTVLVGSPTEPPPEEKKDKTEPAVGTKTDEEARREAERVIRGIDLEVQSDDGWSKVDRIEQPLLFYGDPTRNNERGSVWGWAQKGRPLAVIEMYRGETNRRMWAFAICNTSGGKLRASRAGAPWWRANDSAAELKDVPGAPAPSADAAVRQRQLKLLAQKFTAHEFWDPSNTRYELRLLKRPLYTYRDEAGGILDGGMFTLANGTNPEILLFLEARVDPKDGAKRTWQWTVGRLAHAELHLEHDGKEVFDAPRGNRLSAPDQPYWLSFLSPVRGADPEKP